MGGGVNTSNNSGAYRGRQRGSHRSKFRRSPGAISEINVTPFVDVMLVLLIVFMVTAPLLTSGVQIDLPKSQATSISDSDEPLVLSLNLEGQIFIQDTPTEFTQLIPRLQAITGNNADLRIFVRGDTNLNYGRVMQVMGALNAAGFNKVALLSSPPDS